MTVNVIRLDSRIRKLEGRRGSPDEAEVRALSDDKLVAILRESGSTDEDEAFIAWFQHGTELPADFDLNVYLGTGRSSGQPIRWSKT